MLNTLKLHAVSRLNGILPEKAAAPADARSGAAVSRTRWLVLVVLLLLPVWPPLPADINVLNEFRPTDGYNPIQARLIWVESTGRWYGTACYGGDYGKGILFRMMEDGGEYTILHHFGGPGDGQEPLGSLVLQGDSLFGVTRSGGSSSYGTVYRLFLSGRYTILHHFTNKPDGAKPAGLTNYGGMLYGSTEAGGTYSKGTVFKIDTGGGGYNILHHFGNSGDGRYPSGPPVVEAVASGIFLYGVTTWKEHCDCPPIPYDYYVYAVYKIKDGTAEYNLFGNFNGHATGQLALSGSFLYGMDSYGVAKIATDGTFSEWIFRFDILEGTTGTDPEGSLVQSGIFFYGMTTKGGANGSGTIFKVSTSGYFRKLKDFTGGTEDGAAGTGTLSLRNGFLYGLTHEGGFDNKGTAFRIDPDGGRFSLLHRFDNGAGANPYGDLLALDGWLYGMTFGGGKYGLGTVFRVAPGGSGHNLLYSFAGGANGGSRPRGTLTALDGWLYGMTEYGGLHDKGTIFKIGTDGTGFTLLHSFGESGDGRSPTGSLAVLIGQLFGVTQTWGANGAGTLFKINTSGTYTLLHNFTSTTSDGAQPLGSLTTYSGRLYGTTGGGGEKGGGTIFYIRSYGDFTVMKSFNGTDGANPCGSLTPWSGMLYGMTWRGGEHNGGTVFKTNTGGTHTLLHSFDGTAGEPWSNGSPAIVGGIIYGMTKEGGTSGKGTIFRLAADGSGYTRLHSFSGPDGANPNGSLIVSGSALYGMTSKGGSLDRGTIFSLALHPVLFTRSGNGSLSGLASQQVADGDSTQPVTAVPSYGYRFEGWTGDGGFASTGNPLTVTAVTGPLNIKANFVVDPFLTVRSPNGGEAFLAGAIREITWRSNGPISNVKIEYSINSGTGWATVSNSTPNTGSYPWTVPGILSPFCLIRISDVANPAVFDVSDAVFTITDASLTVTSPNGGETWLAGANQSITWTSTGTIANIKIQYSTTGRSSWQTVADFTPNTGSYPWTVPDTISTKCKVRISDLANPAVEDLSDNSFTITEFNPPDTEITNTVCGNTIDNPSVIIECTGSDDCTSSHHIKFAWKLDAGSWSDYDSSKSRLFSWLTAGEHTVSVRSLDEAGNVDPSPAECAFTVELEELPGDVTRDGKVNVADLLVMEQAMGYWNAWRFSWICREAGDLNGNGSLDSDDCGILARYLAEKVLAE